MRHGMRHYFGTGNFHPPRQLIFQHLYIEKSLEEEIENKQVSSDHPVINQI